MAYTLFLTIYNNNNHHPS